MYVKVPSTLFSLILFSFIISRCNSFEIKAVLYKITHPGKNIFSHHHHHESHIEDNTVDPKEHGNFDFLGRDVVREASKKIKDIGRSLSSTFSKDTKGLDCNKTFSSEKNNFKKRVQAIYPGTKWCGDGNISKSFTDLGRFSTTDSCCRDHDLCPSNIPADSTKFDLVNTGLFTRSHCNCNKRFYDCLKNARSVVADSIGYTYFTILGPQCFKQDFPITGCHQERKGKCVDYVKDTSAEKVYQWFDSPPF